MAADPTPPETPDDGPAGKPPAEAPRQAPEDPDRLGDYRRPTMYFERERSLGRGAAIWAGVGIEFALYVVLFFLGGQWLDGKFGWEPWGGAVGALLGVFLGMTMLIRRAARLSTDDSGPPDGP